MKTKKPDPNAKFYTSEEACALLGCCRRTLYRYEQRGLLKAKRRNSRLIVWPGPAVRKLV